MSWVAPAVVLFWVNVAAPVTVNAPLWLRAPLLPTSRVPVAVVVPRIVAVLFTRLTLLPARLTAPVKALPASVSVIAFVPALNVAAPANAA